MRLERWAVAAALVLAAANVLAAEEKGAPAANSQAERILQATGVKGGLVVHVGCGDGRLTAALRTGEQYLIHGLDRDAGNVSRAREHVRSLGLYGPVSIDGWSGGGLPYADNLVNLLVGQDPGSASMEEVLRVLAPDGVAYLRHEDGWTKRVKPRPADIDEWTHFLHDASGNAVAHDARVGPPRRLQWAGEPTWARHHDYLASISALVSAGGRIFYFVDEGPTAFVPHPARWRLVARDAFNGVVLWKRQLPAWVWHLWGFRSGPVQIQRCLVAAGDRVFVTVGCNEPVSCLDAATGNIIRTYPDTERTREIIYQGGLLLLAVARDNVKERWLQPAGGVKAPESKPPVPGGGPQTPVKPSADFAAAHRLLALDAQTGAVAWSRDLAGYFPLTLAADAEHACFKDGDNVFCVGLKTGKELWRSEIPLNPSPESVKGLLLHPSFASTLVIHKEVVLYGDGVKLAALSGRDGARLWDAPCAPGFSSPTDVFVAGDLVWVGTDPKNPSAFAEGRDPKTGQVKKTARRAQVGLNAGGANHARCYRGRATDRYLLAAGRCGTDFHSLESDVVLRNDWIRGACQYGVMPANGLLYAPSHACACFTEGMLKGFCAVAADDTPCESASDRAVQPPGGDEPLERGPAYSSAEQAPTMADDPQDWPTYRHDPARSGTTTSAVHGPLREAWKADLGVELSSVVAAGGQVFVASPEVHAVLALDAANGALRWRRTVGGRVDSPPTVHAGLAIFGCADGWVYCLRAADGELAWRFRAAPRDRRVVACGGVESAWPVHGSVLVEDGNVYCAAGRASFLDGGLHLLKIDAKTGQLLAQRRLGGYDPQTGADLLSKQENAVLSDILSGDGTGIYIRQAKLKADNLAQAEPADHLFSNAGFLDDSWAQRTFWLFGTQGGTRVGFSWTQAAEKVPQGRILVADSSRIFGYGRSTFVQARGNKPDHLLWALPRRPKGPATSAGRAARPPGSPYEWSQPLPLQVRAMVLAGATLLVAGPAGDYRDLEALEGRKGSVLLAVSAVDGKPLAERKLDAPPVFDGLAVSRGRAYVALADGTVVCFAGEESLNETDNTE